MICFWNYKGLRNWWAKWCLKARKRPTTATSISNTVAPCIEVCLETANHSRSFLWSTQRRYIYAQQATHTRQLYCTITLLYRQRG